MFHRSAFAYVDIVACMVPLFTFSSIMVPAMKLYTSAGYEHWRKGFMPEQRREMLRASGDEDL